jgi:D-amino peptidase
MNGGLSVLVSVDMEGVAGVVHNEDIHPGHAEYERSRALLTAEANAAVRGVHAYAADARVLVADAHAQFRNIVPELLDHRAELVRGSPRPHAMMAGLAADVDAVLFVGYHGKAGTARSVLAHTISGAVIADVRCDGVSVGELGLNAALAAHHGVPPVLVTGDDTVATEAAEVAPGMHCVVVKRALGAHAASTLHPQEACRRIELEVPRALAGRARPAGSRCGTSGRVHAALRSTGLPDRVRHRRTHRRARRRLITPASASPDGRGLDGAAEDLARRPLRQGVDEPDRSRYL